MSTTNLNAKGNTNGINGEVMISGKYLLVFLLLLPLIITYPQKPAASESQGKYSYGNFEKPNYCGAACHKDFYQQWTQTMMSQAYTHHWDEIEYFKLALPHSKKDPVVAEVKAGCNGCHTPMAFLSGDIPPAEPEMKTRANEAVSCDVCHTITGFSGDVPHNFNFISEPGKTKYAFRNGIESPAHKIAVNEFYKTSDFCGTCHNEKSPYGVWVKSTHLEWKEGPYSKEGVRCQDCHMPSGPSKTASMGQEYTDSKQHLFNGAHDPGKIKGTIELRIHPDIRKAEPGETVKFTISLFNQKTGHKFPSGSAEERLVWMTVDAVDSKGNKYHLPVDKKGFPGEEFTISADVLAYQDMSVPLELPDFKGILRDGIPAGNRIFRLPYFDPRGRMTIQQWNTKSLGTDYRIGPRETKIETCTFNIPYNVSPGELKITATINYQKLPRPVAEFLEVPLEEAEIIKVNEHSTSINIHN